MTEVQPESVNVLRVETFDGEKWMIVVKGIVSAKRTGSIELHFCQGRIGKVQWKEKQQKVPLDIATPVSVVFTR